MLIRHGRGRPELLRVRKLGDLGSGRHFSKNAEREKMAKEAEEPSLAAARCGSGAESATTENSSQDRGGGARALE